MPALLQGANCDVGRRVQRTCRGRSRFHEGPPAPDERPDDVEGTGGGDLHKARLAQGQQALRPERGERGQGRWSPPPPARGSWRAASRRATSRSTHSRSGNSKFMVDSPLTSYRLAKTSTVLRRWDLPPPTKAQGRQHSSRSGAWNEGVLRYGSLLTGLEFRLRSNLQKILTNEPCSLPLEFAKSAQRIQDPRVQSENVAFHMRKQTAIRKSEAKLVNLLLYRTNLRVAITILGRKCRVAGNEKHHAPYPNDLSTNTHPPPNPVRPLDRHHRVGFIRLGDIFRCQDFHDTGEWKFRRHGLPGAIAQGIQDGNRLEILSRLRQFNRSLLRRKRTTSFLSPFHHTESISKKRPFRRGRDAFC